MKPLRLADITDNVVIIKINKLFHNGMSELELYETTRGIWKRKIESVEKADYALAVYKGIVIEVYKITNWAKAGTYPMQTRQIDPKRCKDRIEFHWNDCRARCTRQIYRTRRFTIIQIW